MAEPKRTNSFEKPPRKGIDRRTFVRRAVGTAAFGAAGAVGLGTVAPLSTTLGIKIPRFPYFGARIIGGPAPKGIPIIPVEIKDGFVNGVPSLLDWYKYCSHDEAPGLQEGFTNDNKFYYFQNEEKIHVAESQGLDLWYSDKLNQPLRLDDFDEYGKGAPFKWRSQNQFDNNIITGIAIKLRPDQIQGLAEAEELVGGPFIDQDIIAFCSFCAHFCCVPGYKESRQADQEGWWEKMFCTCHGSVYDPFDLRQYQFPPNQ